MSKDEPIFHQYHSKDGMCTLMFTEQEVDVLIQILNFANSAASVLSNQEMKPPGSLKNAAKMNRLASDAKELLRIVSISVTIGEPVTGERH